MNDRQQPDVAFDRLVHEPVRLAILTYLASSQESETPFTVLRDDLDLSAGNLSVQLRNLEEAGYVKVDKRISGRKPVTSVALTLKGRDALQQYVQKMEQLIRSIKAKEE